MLWASDATLAAELATDCSDVTASAALDATAAYELAALSSPA